MKTGNISDKKSAAVAAGEVLASTITGFTAQLNRLPDGTSCNFGSFVRVDAGPDMEVLAVVFDVITGPPDNHHRPAALGMTREQLQAEQPHIFALLRTEIHAQTIGYRAGGRLICGLPPRPPQVHDFIYQATDDEITEITQSLEFLRLLTGVSSVPSDELLAASIKQAYLSAGCNYQFLVSAGQALSHLYREDYDRLMSLLRKIKPS